MQPLLAVLSATHVVLVAFVILLLFGAQKIPPLMRSVGAGLSEFKRGLKEGEQTWLDEASPPPQPSDAPSGPARIPEPALGGTSVGMTPRSG